MQIINGNEIRVEGVDRVFHRYKILFVLLLPLAMALMAVSSVNVALPAIETGLGATASDLQWILSGYSLAFGMSLIPAGRAGDVLGRGSMFVLGLVLFIAGSLTCGLASTPLLLNLARALQGIGAGLYNPQIVGMIQQYFTGGGRAKAFALFGLVISVSVAIGPILAGGIIAAIGPAQGWRWAFLINIPFGVAGVVLALAWFPFSKERRTIRAWRSSRADGRGVLPSVDLDPMGTLILALAVLGVMLPFVVRETVWVWLALPAALGLLVLWVLWERRYEASGHAPLVDMSLFAFSSFTYGTLISGIMFMGVTSTFVMVAIYLQGFSHVSALEVGLLGLPNAIASAYSSIWGAKGVMEYGRRTVIISLTTILVGAFSVIGVALLVADFGVSFWWLALPLILQGFGMGAMSSSNQTLSLEDVPVANGGTAGGVKQTAERVGTAVGSAICTGVFFGVHQAMGWTSGFVAGFVSIAVFVGIALVLAIRDQRLHRAGVHQVH